MRSIQGCGARKATHWLVQELQPLCDDEVVAEVALIDGTRRMGVLLGVSSSRLVLDRWDPERRDRVGKPFVVDLASIVNVTTAA